MRGVKEPNKSEQSVLNLKSTEKKEGQTEKGGGGGGRKTRKEKFRSYARGRVHYLKETKTKLKQGKRHAMMI